MALVLLVPHFLITALYLKPEFIIRKLVRRVDDAYLRSLPTSPLTHGGQVDVANDRLLPVVEITERAIDRGDIITARGALQQIEQVYFDSVDRLQDTTVDEYIVGHLVRIGRKALVQSDEEQAARQVIRILGQIGASGRYDLAIEAIDALGFSALKHESEVAVSAMIDSLKQVLDNGSHDAGKAVLTIYADLSGKLASGGEERLLRHLGAQLREIGFEAQRRADADLEERCLDLVEATGRGAARNAMIAVVLQCAKALRDLGVSAAASDAKSEETVLRLLRIERDIDRNEREAIAALEVARGEVERLLKPSVTNLPETAEDDLGLSDLWRESNH